MKLIAASAFALAALVLVVTASASGATHGTVHGAPHRIHGLVPHIGNAQRLSAARPAPRAAGLNCIAACSAYESTINQYLTDVAHDSGLGTNVYSVMTQYSSIQYSVAFDAATNAYVDGNPYPTTNTCKDGFDKFCVTDQQLQNEIGKVIAAHGWPTHSTTALYFIFTPAKVGVCEFPGTASNANPCTTNAFCAYHSARVSTANVLSFIYAVEPDAAAVSGGACSSGQAPAGHGADATINTVSHEQIEAITDPLGTAWTSNDVLHGFPEIADLCAYDFGGPLGTPGTEYNQVINGHNYLLQLEYSNQDSGCVPYLGGPVTPADPRDGSGPLVYDTNDNGPVMTTNTVYAIYWVPAVPGNTVLPKITGTSKVGKKLTASHGAWSYAPKSFKYRWLRCSAAGTLCKGIAMANRSTYTLVKADAGHRIEVQVTATNAAGSATATSAPTPVIAK